MKLILQIIGFIVVVAILFGLVFFFLSYAVWMLGVRKYDFTGS